MFEKTKQTIAAGLAALSIGCAPEIHRIQSPNTVSAEAARLVTDIIATIPDPSCAELRGIVKDQAMLVVDLDTVHGLSADLIDGRTHVAVTQGSSGDKTRMTVHFTPIDPEAPKPAGDFHGDISTECR